MERKEQMETNQYQKEYKLDEFGEEIYVDPGYKKMVTGFRKRGMNVEKFQITNKFARYLKLEGYYKKKSERRLSFNGILKWMIKYPTLKTPFYNAINDGLEYRSKRYLELLSIIFSRTFRQLRFKGYRRIKRGLANLRTEIITKGEGLKRANAKLPYTKKDLYIWRNYCNIQNRKVLMALGIHRKILYVTGNGGCR